MPPDLTTWLTKAEAAARLQTSTRTIERYISRGEIETRSRKRPGRKPEPVCNPDDVERLAPHAHVMPARSLAPLAPRQPAAALAPATQAPDALAMLAAFAQAMAAPRNGQPATRFLTLEQASEASGLSQRFLRRAIASGDLPAVKDGRAWKVRREDLDKL